jgi:putative mRNA 3-end processing factor
MELKFLGGTMEVGRSAVSVKSNNNQILMDYGALLAREPGFPMHVPPKEVDAIFLTHSHLDHCGSIPVFYINGSMPLYGTSVTFDVSRLLIEDFLGLSGYYLPFEYLELEEMMNHSKNLSYKESVKIGDFGITLYDAGHMPGSAQILVEDQGKRLLYTGDVNTNETRLTKGADLSYGEVDTLIIEGTYANEDHPPRKEIEDDLVKKVKEVVEEGGTVLIPAFAVSRSQEVLMVLVANDFDYPIALDGMALDVDDIYLRNSEFIKDPRALARAISESKQVKGWKDRRKAVKRPGVIISPAGMLKGGASVFYMEKLAGNSANAIYPVGYQVRGTPGRTLLEQRKYISHGKVSKVEAKVERFDFSSHCGKSGLEKIIKNSAPKKIFIMHGDEENLQTMSKWIKDEMGIDAITPKTGESFKI